MLTAARLAAPFPDPGFADQPAADRTVRLAGALGMVAVADALWMVTSPRGWRRFWTFFTQVLGRRHRLRWLAAALQGAVGLALLKSAVRSAPQ